MNTPAPRKRRRWIVPTLALLSLSLVGVGAAAFFGLLTPEDPLAGKVLVPVRQGPLLISVTESGTIRAREQVTLKSEVEGRNTIIFLIPEGTLVEKGELLVELDSSDLINRKVDQEIRVENAYAAMVRARENLEVTLSQGRSDILRAEMDFRFAQEDLRKYQEGDFPKQRLEAENRIALAEQELKRTAETLAWSERFFAEQYISATEFERDQIAHNKARIDLELAQTELQLLLNFTSTRRLAELQSNVEQTEMSLDRVQRKARADEVQVRADLRAREADLNTQRNRLEKIIDQIGKTRIYAPAAGMVVYPTTGQTRWGSNVDPLAEGQQVREREELIHLPAPGALIAELKIHESVLDKVRVGQRALITIDALPGRRFEGRLTRIAPLPDAASMFMNPDLKVYNTIVELSGEPTAVRTGMSCKVEIIVEVFEDTQSVPVQSVVRVDDQPTVFVVEGGRLHARPVTIGLDNGREVRIIDGLETDEMVSLTPPLELGERRVDAAFAGLAGSPQAAEASTPEQTATQPVSVDGSVSAGSPDGQRSERRRPANTASEGRPEIPDAGNRPNRRPDGVRPDGDGREGRQAGRTRPGTAEAPAPANVGGL